MGVVRAEVSAGAQFRICEGGARAGRSRPHHHVPPCSAQRHGGDVDFPAVHTSGALVTLTSLDFLGFGLPPGSPSLGELLKQGKDNLQAPWLGITGFVIIA